MIDTHAHLHDRAFDPDRDAVLQRAREAGVQTVVTIGCDLEDSARALETARQFGGYACAGIHPHEAIGAPEDLASAMAPLLEDPRVVAIGEIGLDYHYDHSPRDVQRRVLREQLRIARERALPVVFHQREAYGDFVAILREEFVPANGGVVHCFTGDAAAAAVYTGEFGLYLGIGGVLTFASAKDLRAAVAAAGIERLVLETDCPYLAPVPHRGKRNEPAFMLETAHALCGLLALPFETVVRVTQANARELFRLPAPA